MIHGIKSREIRSNRTSKKIAGITDRVNKVSEKLNRDLSRFTTSSTESFSLVIHNKLALMNAARKRDETVWGRWVNRLMREDADHVVLSGVELKTLLDYFKENADIEILYSASREYLVPYNEVEAMHEKIIRKV